MKKKRNTERNWALVIVASVVVILNAGLLVFTVLHTASLGWWSLVIAGGSISSICLSVIAIKKNDPAWLMLDMVLPN